MQNLDLPTSGMLPKGHYLQDLEIDHALVISNNTLNCLHPSFLLDFAPAGAVASGTCLAADLHILSASIVIIEVAVKLELKSL